MRKLLLGAKWIAIQQGHTQIELDDVQSSIRSLEATNHEAYETLCAALEVAPDQVKSERFSEQDLDKVAAQERLPYTPEVLDFIKTMKSRGLEIASQVTEVYQDMSKRKGSYHAVLSHVAEMRGLLQSKIFDQDVAIEEVSDAVMRMAWNDKPNRPSAIFFFLGPPATGKTYMAELLGQGLQGYKFLSFDMTQYTSEQEGFALVGLRKGFESAGVGLLTNFVKENPKSVIVFDELEKAHTRVQTSLLRLLSSGYLRDEYSQEDIDCRETIIVFTSNLGSGLYSNRSFAEQTRSNPHQARESLLDVIRRERKVERGHEVGAIPPEMLSRLSQGAIVLFNKLSMNGLSNIATAQLLTERTAFQRRLGIAVGFGEMEYVVKLLVLGFAPDFDARAIKSRLSSMVYDPITDYLQQNPDALIDKVVVVLADDTREFVLAQDMDTLTQQLAIKHQRIYFDHDITQRDNRLILTFSAARIEKLAKGDDFGDASGIQVKLPTESFSDIAGHEKIKQRLTEIVNLVKNSKQLEELGVKPPKGMLLYGVPGTGKTLLAKAFAHEADLPFLACTGNDLLNEEFIRKLFARAREYAPSIIFIDEIDALPKRGVGGAYADALVNRMLVELDGFSTTSPGNDIFVIAATNRKELIDDAILRSGRIDLQFEVPQLDKGARRWFIEQMLKKPIFDNQINVDRLTTLTAGLSGADLQKVARESVLYALRENRTLLDEATLLEQINTLKYGQPLDLASSETQLLETAYHEAAHAVISKIVLPERKIEQITVVARSDFLGMVSYDQEQRNDYTRDFLFGLTCVALAGRAAQTKRFGDKGLDSGASGDLKQAMRYAWLAIGNWGMDSEMFNMDLNSLREFAGIPLYEELLEVRLRHWIDSATTKTNELVAQYWDKIEAIALEVLDKEILDEQSLLAIMEN
jgi:ATP-dependent Zn protease